MRTFRKVQKEENELCEITCNKCGKSFEVTPGHGAHDESGDPVAFTRIKTSFGYGSTRDGNTYYADICETCRDAFADTFKIPPQVVSMFDGEWGVEPPEPLTITAPVAPVMEEHAPQEETPQEG
jgi:hypothetical protein